MKRESEIHIFRVNFMLICIVLISYLLWWLLKLYINGDIIWSLQQNNDYGEILAQWSSLIKIRNLIKL